MAVDNANQRMIKSFSNLALSFAKAQMRTREGNEKAIGQEASIKFKNDAREQFYHMSILGDAQDEKGNPITNALEFERYQNELSDKLAEGLSPTARNAFLGRIVSTRESMFSQSIKWQLESERTGRASIALDDIQDSASDVSQTIEKSWTNIKGNLSILKQNGFSASRINAIEKKAKKDLVENKAMFEVNQGDYEDAKQVVLQQKAKGMIDDTDYVNLVKKINSMQKANAILAKRKDAVNSLKELPNYSNARLNKKEEEAISNATNAHYNMLSTGKWGESGGLKADLEYIFKHPFDNAKGWSEHIFSFDELDKKRITKLPKEQQKLFNRIPAPLLREAIQKVKADSGKDFEAVLVPNVVKEIQQDPLYKDFLQYGGNDYDDKYHYMIYYLFRAIENSGKPLDIRKLMGKSIQSLQKKWKEYLINSQAIQNIRSNKCQKITKFPPQRTGLRLYWIKES